MKECWERGSKETDLNRREISLDSPESLGWDRCRWNGSRMEVE